VGVVLKNADEQIIQKRIEDEIAFGCENLAFPPEKIKKQIEIVCKLMKLSPEWECRKLSGGQKRRVAIAGVIVTAPEVLVLDEPVAGLDPKGKRELMRLLADLKGKACKTGIIVSHDMDEVAENCNKAAVFSCGEVIKTGTVSETFSDAEELAALRLGLPLTAYLKEELKKNGINIEPEDLTEESFVKAIKDYIDGKC